MLSASYIEVGGEPVRECLRPDARCIRTNGRTTRKHNASGPIFWMSTGIKILCSLLELLITPVFTSYANLTTTCMVGDVTSNSIALPTHFMSLEARCGANAAPVASAVSRLRIFSYFFIRPRYGSENIVISVSLSVCLSVYLSVRDYTFGTTRPIFTNFLCVLPSVEIRYVLPVLWMTSYLLISQGCSTSPRPAEAQCTRSLGLGYKLCAIIPLAGQRTLKVTSQVATPGAESAVSCLRPPCFYRKVSLNAVRVR